MADTADMVVLGAWYGKGRKGGLLSTFLMGCLDKRTGEWKTVTKAHGGLGNATLERLQDEMKAIMVKSGKEEGRSFELVKSLAMKPDFIMKDPKKVPVWELTGAEFTRDVTGGGG
uniref:ATP-dependent DNA ligase family profile domain-containing protein n=1 Tax=Scylla olivacea TaxID=85551 RepID=A0A0P4VU83_SCYOL